MLWSDEVEQRIQSEAHSLDRQHRPSEVIQCKTCVITNQRPRIVIDDDGICSACRFMEHHKTGIDWGTREAELFSLLDKYRSGGKYDVVVPCSGGKDSSAVAWKLKHKYGMHPLCVKWGPFLYTEIGRQNFDAFNQSGFDTIEFRPDALVYRKLARLAFEYLGDAFQPFVYGQLAFPMNMAAKFDIPLVFGGENGEAFYGGDPAANDKPCWSFNDWERVYLKGSGVDQLIKLGRELGAFSHEESASLSTFFRMPKIDKTQPEYHWLSYYNPWHPQSNYYLAAEKCGFQANAERSEGTYSKYASLDDATDGFHYWMAYVKFGLGRATSDAAHEVRDGDRDLDEARALVLRYDGEFPKRYFAEFKDYLGLTDEQFWRVVERFRGAGLPAHSQA